MHHELQDNDTLYVCARKH